MIEFSYLDQLSIDLNQDITIANKDNKIRRHCFSFGWQIRLEACLKPQSNIFKETGKRYLNECPYFNLSPND